MMTEDQLALQQHQTNLLDTQGATEAGDGHNGQQQFASMADPDKRENIDPNMAYFDAAAEAMQKMNLKSQASGSIKDALILEDAPTGSELPSMGPNQSASQQYHARGTSGGRNEGTSGTGHFTMKKRRRDTSEQHQS